MEYKENQAQKTRHQIGKVIEIIEEKISAQADSQFTSLPIYSPFGIYSLPPVNSTVLILAGQNGNVCLGNMQENIDIMPGEICIKSLGGAEIFLKNNGQVIINGQVFSAKEA